MSDQRRGFLLGVAAYVMWGLFPLYWPLLEPAGAVEILAHRVAWSMVTMVALTVLLRRTSQLRAILRSRRSLTLLTVAAVVIAFNWGGFIYGVNADRVVEVSLGYFINPLVTVLLGVFVLGERLRPVQWAAMGLAAVAVVVLAVDYGHPPWIALLLAFSFGTYGLAKKKADRRGGREPHLRDHRAVPGRPRLAGLARRLGPGPLHHRRRRGTAYCW